MLGQLSWSRLVVARRMVRCGLCSNCNFSVNNMKKPSPRNKHRFFSRCVYVESGHKLHQSSHLITRLPLSSYHKKIYISWVWKSLTCMEMNLGRKCYSSIKNDDELKSLLKEIRGDFGQAIASERDADASSDLQVSGDVNENPEAIAKLVELSNKMANVNPDHEDSDVVSDMSSSSDGETSSSDFDVDEGINMSDRDLDVGKSPVTFDIQDFVDKQGFTVEEMIEILKKTKYPVDFEVDNFTDTVDVSDNEILEIGGDKASQGTNASQDLDKFEEKLDSNASEHEVNNNVKESSTGIEGDVIAKENTPSSMDKPTSAYSNVKTDWSVVEIEDFVNIAEAEADIETPWRSPVDLRRGQTGVYDIEDLVAVLRAANAVDIAVMRLPDKVEFADYMVVVSAKSVRHLKAITADVQWIYKQKKARRDKFVRLEGEGTDWCAMDLGNIVLHLFMPKTRELYDLETLWTVGPEFDPNCMEEKDPYVFSVDDLPWLKELEQSQNSEKSHDSSDQ